MFSGSFMMCWMPEEALAAGRMQFMLKRALAGFLKTLETSSRKTYKAGAFAYDKVMKNGCYTRKDLQGNTADSK